MIPKCLERKLDELQAICAEHGLYFAWVVLDEHDNFLYRSRGDDAFLVTAAAIILQSLERGDGGLADVMGTLEFEREETVEEEDFDEEELPEGLEDMFEE